jgi:glutathione S-transferase
MINPLGDSLQEVFMIELYGSPTPSSYTIAIMLEEIGFDYTVFPITKSNEPSELELLQMTPNNMFPVILDRVGLHNKPLTIFEPEIALAFIINP